MGNSHLSTQNEAGDNFVEMAMSLELGILNTIVAYGRPDVLWIGMVSQHHRLHLGPLSGLGCVKKVVTCWKLDAGCS